MLSITCHLSEVGQKKSEHSYRRFSQYMYNYAIIYIFTNICIYILIYVPPLSTQYLNVYRHQTLDVGGCLCVQVYVGF